MPDVDNQIGVFLTLETVFPGDQPGLDSLKDLLKDLNRSEVIGICSRLNLSISDHLNEGTGSWLERHVRKQWETATSFFRPEHLANIQDFIQKHPHCSIVFRGQLIELIRWAALFCRDEGRSLKYEEVVCCESFIGDGGWPPEVGLQGQASNRHKLRG
jgi:hypothetical protein